MMKFFRLLAGIRYWRNRALRVERELLAARAQAEAERWRNINREDMFVSAAVLGSRGMVGIPPRSGPAYQPERSTFPALAQVADPWDALSYNERAEFETLWLADARRNGVSDQKAKSDFMVELAKRKRFNDEPMN